MPIVQQIISYSFTDSDLYLGKEIGKFMAWKNCYLKPIF
jgi:hypothetical protein